MQVLSRACWSLVAVAPLCAHALSAQARLVVDTQSVIETAGYAQLTLPPRSCCCQLGSGVARGLGGSSGRPERAARASPAGQPGRDPPDARQRAGDGHQRRAQCQRARHTSRLPSPRRSQARCSHLGQSRSVFRCGTLQRRYGGSRHRVQIRQRRGRSASGHATRVCRSAQQCGGPGRGSGWHPWPSHPGLERAGLRSVRVRVRGPRRGFRARVLSRRRRARGRPRRDSERLGERSVAIRAASLVTSMMRSLTTACSCQRGGGGRGVNA